MSGLQSKFAKHEEKYSMFHREGIYQSFNSELGLTHAIWEDKCIKSYAGLSTSKIWAGVWELLKSEFSGN